ncbi:MAG: MBL fold metallo-hydrolase [Gemmatimonadales bacterium]|nr:MBL fold metallo-hydrolase [Gemmatimonadales bacterium]NIN12316.1 MBL fold metallo-hydrolase [Gemmatimonadales bacterium]NIN48854.1 MBL fold metallo-hydrolase [Gemmatimonadales bacterium]NIP06318.1 MBL fold metallo-hydrolase [Gemmatimonadales bacterium]NIR00690.1 MBL fold metallo-hydrolase [Gemmatimonadales bacterium]
MAYTITIWGARGSVPTPGALTTRYGGNTPCVAVQCGSGAGERLVILDAGTGIRLLGKQLVKLGNGSLQLDLLLSHTHWDHIQGLPFFAPFFGKGNEVRIWGSKQGDVDLGVILRQQMHPVVFPVPLDQLSAELTVAHVGPGAFEIDGFAVEAIRLRHPGNTLGYRLTPTDGGASMAYVTDNELGSGGSYDVAPTWRTEFVQFLAGVQVLIHDAMYAPGDLDQHRGWGHSTPSEAVALAGEAGVKQLLLFHHRPEHDDAVMDNLLEATRNEAEEAGHSLDVFAATEGMQLTL